MVFVCPSPQCAHPGAVAGEIQGLWQLSLGPSEVQRKSSEFVLSSAPLLVTLASLWLCPGLT